MDRLYEALEHFTHMMEFGAMPPVDFYPFLKYIPQQLLGNWVSRANSVHHEIHGVYGDLIEAVRQRRQKQGRQNSFIDNVLDRQEKLNLTEHQLWLLGGVAVDGGSETSAASILSFLKAMTCYPDVQKRAQDEIDGVMDGSRSPVWADYNDLPYVSGVVKETMRWRPVGGLIPPHATSEGEYARAYPIIRHVESDSFLQLLQMTGSRANSCQKEVWSLSTCGVCTKTRNISQTRTSSTLKDTRAVPF
jgi:cytochrome P450